MTEGTERVCAFSDGVFAIACTLLILEIRLPHDEAGGTLSHHLRALWPSYLAFALSFFVILVTWITHHDLMQLVRATDRPVRLANGCALLYVTFIPFPTAVLAEHLGGPEMSTAVAFYCGTFVVGSAFFNILVATLTHARLFLPGTDAAVAKFRKGYRITFVIYLAATMIALVAPWVALFINVAVRLHLLRIAHQDAKGRTAPRTDVRIPATGTLRRGNPQYVSARYPNGEWQCGYGSLVRADSTFPPSDLAAWA